MTFIFLGVFELETRRINKNHQDHADIFGGLEPSYNKPGTVALELEAYIQKTSKDQVRFSIVTQHNLKLLFGTSGFHQTKSSRWMIQLYTVCGESSLNGCSWSWWCVIVTTCYNWTRSFSLINQPLASYQHPKQCYHQSIRVQFNTGQIWIADAKLWLVTGIAASFPWFWLNYILTSRRDVTGIIVNIYIYIIYIYIVWGIIPLWTHFRLVNYYLPGMILY